MKHKIMCMEDAVGMIKDGDAIAISSAGFVGYPEYIVKGIEKRFIDTGSPKELTVTAGCGHGNFDDQLDSRFGHKGLLKRYIASHPHVTPSICTMIKNNEVEGYSLPQGILNQLYRISAAHQPGLFSKIGIGTYIDPRQDGGKLNEITKEDIVELMELDGEEWLFFRSFPVNVAIIRATTADENGNLTIEHEALKLEILETALAAKSRDGLVIAQVERLAAADTLRAKDIIVPAELVDVIVLVEEPEKNHRQTKMETYNPYLSGELKRPVVANAHTSGIFTAESIICRRAVMELYPGAIVNIGVGIGAGVGAVTEEEGFIDHISFTLELGVFGGTPTPLMDFGAAYNATAYISHVSMFDFYHGGGLDISFLGTAQVDQYGNVNVSKFAGEARGQGGFIDISQTSKKTVFVTFFKAKGLNISVADGNVTINNEGEISKFVNCVEQITFNAQLAFTEGREVLYITERAVFELTQKGLMLTEVAPGIDVEKDVISQMDFIPEVSADLKLMDKRIFIPGRMGCFDSIMNKTFSLQKS